MYDKVVKGEFFFGLIFKMVVVLVVLEVGVIFLNEWIMCYGVVILGNGWFYCWKWGGYGVVNMWNFIKKFCDVYFYEVVKCFGIDVIEEMVYRFGFG